MYLVFLTNTFPKTLLEPPFGLGTVIAFIEQRRTEER
jgi:hypothetical protein